MQIKCQSFCDNIVLTEEHVKTHVNGQQIRGYQPFAVFAALLHNACFLMQLGRHYGHKHC